MVYSSNVILKQKEVDEKTLRAVTLNICGIEISRIDINDILASDTFGGHDMPWFQIIKKR